MTDCECSEEYGPCEAHAEVLVVRQGASARTADEQAMVFVDDLLDLGATLSDDDRAIYDQAQAALAAGHDPMSGLSHIDDPDVSQALVELGERLEGHEAIIALWITRDDGYTIVRPHADCPLVD